MVEMGSPGSKGLFAKKTNKSKIDQTVDQNGDRFQTAFSKLSQGGSIFDGVLLGSSKTSSFFDRYFIA